MCKLCETITNGKLHNGRCITKINECIYELQIWQLIGFNEAEQYELFATTEVKYCPDCGCRFGDIPIEELIFSLRTYNCLKNEGINYISELKQLIYDDLIQIRNIGSENIKEIQEILKRY